MSGRVSQSWDAAAVQGHYSCDVAMVSDLWNVRAVRRGFSLNVALSLGCGLSCRSGWLFRGMAGGLTLVECPFVQGDPMCDVAISPACGTSARYRCANRKKPLPSKGFS